GKMPSTMGCYTLEEVDLSSQVHQRNSHEKGDSFYCSDTTEANSHLHHRNNPNDGRLSRAYNLSSSSTSSVLIALLCLLLVSVVTSPVNATGDPVYIRKANGYLDQLLSSDTLRYFKGTAKEPLKLMRPNLDPAVICRVWHTSLRGVGLVSEDQNVCNISTQEGVQGSDKYQTLSTFASRLVWKLWQRPNPPPIGAVAISFKPAKFLATDLNSTVIGYLDPSMNLGSGIFPSESEPATSCLVLTEIEPERYELSDVQLKRNKGFIEEDIVLAYGRLKYELSSSTSGPINSPLDNGAGDSFQETTKHEPLVQLKPETNEIGTVGMNGGDQVKKGKVESILSYETNILDSWGQGYLMAKGLHSSIKLSDGSTKTVEWGIPSTTAGKTETMTAVAELAPGTGVNVTLRGTRIDGEMSYWATLKTIFKDGSFSTRLLEGHRRVKDIQDIRLEHSRIYFLFNGSVVPDPTTTTTTTTESVPFDLMERNDNEHSHDEDEDNEDEDGLLRENALPVESRSDFQADQGHGFSSSNDFSHQNSNSPAASVAHSDAMRAIYPPSLVSCLLLSVVLVTSLKTFFNFGTRFSMLS
ncbi:Protein unzipped, partial [Orchesella cincta]